ncbi:MAG: tRNA (N(6)-L-threonylcarbamoyladenosine(37)-C(2))-methylthiotransferase MtaB [Nitrospiraceae bacterium]|nr:tRNA (N(6)-L-threonylcarbamoyladenosine(37)-C(2))-methylthiotransferase MtaB [Nitrospiraceae bacterium]
MITNAAQPRASLHTLGCRLNQAETAVLGERLRQDGYRLVAFGEPTDLLILNTCSVTEDAERTSRYLIRKTLKHSPKAFIAVTGCYAQTGPEGLKKQAGIDLIVGNQYKLDLPTFLPPSDCLQKYAAPVVHRTKTIAPEDFELPEYGAPDSTRAPLKIQDGCNTMCSFCLIPFARGRERSRLLDDLLREAELLADQGVREIVLTGVNIGQYHQAGADLCTVITQLETIPGLERIRISSIEPTTVTDRLLDLMASSSKLCPYLHIPLQSGDDNILAAMNRSYSAQDYVQLITRALRQIPNLGLGTDIMVGFPGEDETAFGNTLKLATELPFAYFHVFPFSPRSGTAAVKLANPVNVTQMKKRTAVLTSLSQAKRLAVHDRHIGTTLPVLFEAGHHDGFAVGTTSTFLRVAVPSRSELTNQMHSVTITAASERWAVGHLAGRPATTTMLPML